jgi:hypothetical protein
MNLEIGFTRELSNTQFAPLAVLSALYQSTNWLQPLQQVQIPMRQRYYSSSSKLIQIFLSILAGCETLSLVNSLLKHELLLANLWGWDHFADQSSLSRTLDQLTLKQIEVLRSASLQIWKPISQVMARDWRKFLWLDFDLSPLPCGPLAQESQKGYFGEQRGRGRQLARVSAIETRETIWSDVFPGNAHTLHCLHPAVEAAETALDLAPNQRKRTVWRIDGGAGADDEFRWLLAKDYHVNSKGLSHVRAETLAKRVKRWDRYRDKVWIAEVEPPIDYGRKVRVFVKRQEKDEGFHDSYYVSTLSLPSKGIFLHFYDDRGGAEVEQFRADKDGLSMEAKRKHSYVGQKAYILLTDLAHNMLADFYHRALVGSRFEDYGLKRIVRDLFAFPGRLFVEDQQLVRVELLSQKQFSKDLAKCLLKYWKCYQ